MAVYFLDSSALVKRYINEAGSIWVLGLFDPALDNEIFIAAITGVEIIAAVTRRARSGSFSATDATLVCNQFKDDLQTDYQIVEITEGLINAGMTLAEARNLRGYDAVQLAAGCAINTLCLASGLSPVIFVSADSELYQFLKFPLQIVLGESSANPQWTQSLLGASPLTVPVGMFKRLARCAPAWSSCMITILSLYRWLTKFKNTWKQSLLRWLNS